MDVDMPVKREMSAEERKFDRGMRMVVHGVTCCFAAAFVMLLGPILLSNLGLKNEAAERAWLGLILTVGGMHMVGCVLCCLCPTSVVRHGKGVILTGLGMILLAGGIAWWCSRNEEYLKEYESARILIMLIPLLLFAGVTVWILFLWQLAKRTLSGEMAMFAISLAVLCGGSAVLLLTPLAMIFFLLMPYSLVALVLEMFLYMGLLLGLRTRILQRLDQGWEVEDGEDWVS